MATMTAVAHATPLEGGLAGQLVRAFTVSGAGTDITPIRAAVAATQFYILGGVLQTDAAGEFLFQSAAGTIFSLETGVGQLTIPIPLGWTVANEALNITNSGGVGCHIWLITQAVNARTQSPFARP